MTYSDQPYRDPERRVADRPVAVPAAVDYHDRVRWGPILAGLVLAITAQLVLSGIGAAIGLSAVAAADNPQQAAADVGTGVGIWPIISLLIALFLGGWLTTRLCGPMNRSTALLNGTVLWATTIALSAWLLTSGVAGAFGVIGANLGEIINQTQTGTAGTTEGLDQQQVRQIAENAATAGWTFAFGALLGLIATLVGATLGARPPRQPITAAAPPVPPSDVDRPYTR
ncbi:hypothetical protein [Egbenema bharatensis]|uniref:hypothetical protein n=1 Tax=Egbenema bharatensis TaxID=3463334 RepID=UPI003A84D659